MYKKNLVITVALLLLSIVTLINIINSTNSNIKDNKFTFRLNSIYNSMMDTGKELKYINVENSSSGEKLNMNISKSKYLLFVISFDACNTCIWQELEKIKKITTEISEKIKTLYIYYGDSKINALRFKKFMPSRDSIFISIDNQLDSINYSKKYPYILLIKNGIVCDAHFPIPGDTTFSNLFYKRIKEKI